MKIPLVILGLSAVAWPVLCQSPQDAITKANRQASQHPVSSHFINAAMIFDWEADRLYQIYTKPERITDIAFEVDPWHEASKREKKQRAFDHYDARRSDIMFIDKSRGKARQASDDASDDPMMKMLDRSLAMAERALDQPLPDANDMFFMKQTDKATAIKDF